MIIQKGSEIKTPDGPRCKNCHKIIAKDAEAPPGFCCMQCGENKDEDLSQAKLRELVLERDKGVCAICRTDCLALREDMDTLNRMADEADSRGDPRGRQFWKSRVHQLVRIGFPRGPVERGESLWACDHKNEKAAGGASRPEQCQTLCLSCHAKKTKAFASSRALSRKPRRSFGR